MVLVPILKSPMTTSMKEGIKGNSTPRVKFDLPIDKESIVQYIQEEGETPYAIKLNYVIKIISTKDTEDSVLLKWITEFKDNILFFNKSTNSIAYALLKLEWYAKSENFVKAYQEFILNLVTAHPVYLKDVLYCIISVFLKVATEKEIASDNERKMWQHAHELSRRITELIPLSQYTFYVALIEKFPYIKSPPCIMLHYVENLLAVCSYLPDKRHLILECIAEKLIQIDVLCPKNTIETYEMEREEESLVMGQNMEIESSSEKKTDQMAFPLAHTLDILMNCLLTFVKDTCFPRGGDELNWEVTKKLYKEILTVFDKIILPTQRCCHLQYLMFYICSLRQDLSVGFIDYLWKKVQNPNVPPILRQISSFYIGSLLSRAKYINISTVTGCFNLMSNWIHRYIDAHTSRDLESHGTFHSVCQTVFYVFAFRNKELVEMNDGLKYLQSLNFDRIVTCRLNPLRFCDRNIVQNFASVARNHQIAYVYPVIERNNRNLLYSCYQSNTEDIAAGAMISTFFPFDPYLLKRSKHWIEPQYRIYNHANKDEDKADQINDEEMNVDDEIFSYSMSPGFKKNCIRIQS